MPIFYNKVQRAVNPGDAESEKKWYPVAKAIKRATEKEIAKYIARETTLNPKEAEMAIDLLGEARRGVFLCTLCVARIYGALRFVIEYSHNKLVFLG